MVERAASDAPRDRAILDALTREFSNTDRASEELRRGRLHQNRHTAALIRRDQFLPPLWPPTERERSNPVRRTYVDPRNSWCRVGHVVCKLGVCEEGHRGGFRESVRQYGEGKRGGRTGACAGTSTS